MRPHLEIEIWPGHSWVIGDYRIAGQSVAQVRAPVLYDQDADDPVVWWREVADGTRHPWLSDDPGSWSPVTYQWSSSEVSLTYRAESDDYPEIDVDLTYTWSTRRWRRAIERALEVYLADRG